MQPGQDSLGLAPQVPAKVPVGMQAPQAKPPECLGHEGQAIAVSLQDPQVLARPLG